MTDILSFVYMERLATLSLWPVFAFWKRNLCNLLKWSSLDSAADLLLNISVALW